MKKIFCLITLLTITLTSCGKKGPLESPEIEINKHRLDNISDELNKPSTNKKASDQDSASQDAASHKNSQ